MEINFKLFVDIAQTLGIIAGFIFTIFQLRNASKITKFNIFWKIGESHRQIWQNIVDNPSLSPILDDKDDDKLTNITPQVKMAIIIIVLHIEGVFEAHQKGYYKLGENDSKDIGELFNQQLFKLVWDEIKDYQKVEFKNYIEKVRVKYTKTSLI